MACGAGVTGAPAPERARISDVFATAVDALGLRSPPDAGGRSMMVEGDVL